ncbi:GNAT family N-acetyltransferase [uncultured Maricaulis sp.]|uniref:GNAT family N-acetyltransferase n=1 Tax=uncultured Maricaulis sp. TaxID=174710 RepID=UPI00262A9389|nr:GNAT family N-acetyltransferase [uncultured Maricaulis sp.]
MRTQIVSIEDISAKQIVQWNTWACPNGKLISPYFRFEFAEIVARARPDVRVAVIEKEGETIGFFPHHTAHGGIVRPIGAPMSDYQGVIAADPGRIARKALVRAAGGSALVFDNWHDVSTEDDASTHSHVADLGDDGAAFLESRKALHKDHFKKAARRARAAERDFGPLRVTLGDPDGAAFRALAEWKQKQYRDTGKLNVFGIDWVQLVLGDLRRREGQEFSGLTAALWFGDRLAAVEFGLVGADIYHSWFPAYDPELSRYSPGLLLLHGLMEQAPERGLQRIDLGSGGDHYKKYYANAAVPLASGRNLAPGLAALGIRTWELAEHAVERVPGKVGALPGRLRRRWAQVSAFQPRLAPRLASFAGSIAL